MHRQDIIVRINTDGDAIEYSMPHHKCDQKVGSDKITADATRDDLALRVGRSLLLLLDGLNGGVHERYPRLRPPAVIVDTSLMAPEQRENHRQCEEMKRKMVAEIEQWEKDNPPERLTPQRIENKE